MTDQLRLPEQVAVVRVNTSFDRTRRNVPEYGKVRALQLDLYYVTPDELELSNSLGPYPAEEVARGVDALRSLQIPIVGYNLFNHGWRTLTRHADVSALIPHTIDVFHHLWWQLNGEALAAGNGKTTKSGDLKLVELLFQNIPDYRGEPTFPLPTQEIAVLWHRFVTLGTITAANQAVSIPSRSSAAQIIGAQPYYKDARSWALDVCTNFSTLGLKATGLTHPTWKRPSADREAIRNRYKPYLSQEQYEALAPHDSE